MSDTGELRERLIELRDRDYRGNALEPEADLLADVANALINVEALREALRRIAEGDYKEDGEGPEGTRGIARAALSASESHDE